MAQSSDAQPDASTAKAARPWPTWLGRAFAILLLVAACVAAYHFGNRQPIPVEERLYIDPKDLEFGEVWENHRFGLTLPLENIGQHDARIVGFSTSCRSMSIEPGSLTIPAGSVAQVRVTFDLGTTAIEGGCGSRPHDAEQAASSHGTRPLELHVSAHFEKGTTPARWTIRGRVRSALEFSSRHVVFRDDLVHGQPVQPQLIRVTPRTPLRSVHATCDPPLGIARIQRSGNARDAFRIEVTPSATLPLGRFAFSVRLELESLTGEHLPPVLVPVTGTVVHGIEILPPAICLGVARVGDTLSETVLLRSRTGELVAVTPIESDGLLIESLGFENDRFHAFKLTVPVRASGSHQVAAKFRVGDRHQDALTVPVSYYGTVREPKWR